MIAVILAAGKGSRLGKYTTEIPKSLLPLDSTGKTLLDFNINILSEFNLEKIYVVTGFNSEKIENHVRQHDNIEIIYNPFWDCCNVLGSLYMALDTLQDDFLFLHADTLAVPEIWKELIETKGDFILPFERKVCGEEEMKVLVENGKLLEISKLISPEKADGEFLGIAKFSKATIPYFKNTAAKLFKQGSLNHYMESVIHTVINDKTSFNIVPYDIGNKAFVEVDFEEDYQRAKALFGDKE
jgi:choline kinase